MIKNANKKYEKIYNDVNAIYSYILTSSEIEKLSDNIVKLIKFSTQKKNLKIKETDVLLITYADTLTEKKRKSLSVLDDFLRKFLKN